MTAPIILDCDPGHDDAMAILLAQGLPDVELLAITTVAGNHPVDITALNAQRICSLAGMTNVPVARGAEAPLLRPLLTAPEIHGTTGLEGYEWPAPRVPLTRGHAVDLLIDLVMSRPGEITLVPTGPLTNIALAVRREPRIVERVREVVFMGGAYTRGNVTPAAEFNIYVDPEAAAIVFGAGWPLTMVGLEVTHLALASEEVLMRIQALDTPVARAVVGMLSFYRDQQRRELGVNAPPVHDPCAVAYVARPDLIPCLEAQIEVELMGRYTTGMTVTDFKPGAAGNARVGTGLRVEAFWDLFLSALDRIR
jgi:purine nucleosidase